MENIQNVTSVLTEIRVLLASDNKEYTDSKVEIIKEKLSELNKQIEKDFDSIEKTRLSDKEILNKSFLHLSEKLDTIKELKEEILHIKNQIELKVNNVEIKEKFKHIFMELETNSNAYIQFRTVAIEEIEKKFSKDSLERVFQNADIQSFRLPIDIIVKIFGSIFFVLVIVIGTYYTVNNNMLNNKSNLDAHIKNYKTEIKNIKNNIKNNTTEIKNLKKEISKKHNL